MTMRKVTPMALVLLTAIGPERALFTEEGCRLQNPH